MQKSACNNAAAVEANQQNQQWFAVNLHDITFTTLNIS